MSNTLTALPRSKQEALDPAWLTPVLAPVTGGATIESVTETEILRTMATKIRFVAHWPGGSGAFCLKAFLDVDEQSARGASVTITEADFYTQIGPELQVRVPDCVAALTDRAGQHGIIIMRDLVDAGARFCSALEPFGVEDVADSLDQLARLHAGGRLLARHEWIGRMIQNFASNAYVPAPALQSLLDGSRGEGLDAGTRNGARLLAGLSALAAEDAKNPATLIHGDCHAGNLYVAPEGFGLIDWQLLQRGGWALDVVYHIAALLPVELATREEFHLLRHYLERARAHGAEVPAAATAEAQFRTAAVYGYYLWAITRRVDPAVIDVFVNRLGSAVARHDSFRLLGV